MDTEELYKKLSTLQNLNNRLSEDLSKSYSFNIELGEELQSCQKVSDAQRSELEREKSKLQSRLSSEHHKYNDILSKNTSLNTTIEQATMGLEDNVEKLHNENRKLTDSYNKCMFDRDTCVESGIILKTERENHCKSERDRWLHYLRMLSGK